MTTATRMERLVRKLGLKYAPVQYQCGWLAFEAAARMKAGAVVLGDNGFWVVCLSDAERLARAGYEWVG